MNYLIKFILLLLISYNANSNEYKKNEILFKINNKVFTNVDLEKRIEYVAVINNFDASNLSKSENDEILQDYISSLIFYEYYLQNGIFYKNLKNEIESLYKKKFKDNSKNIKKEIENLKFNLNIDLIRNKLIEEELNSKKNSLLQEVKTPDLLYNYDLQNIIIRENLIDLQIVNKIENRKDFESFKVFLEKNNIDFFFKKEEIIYNKIISKNIKNIIKNNLKIYFNSENGFLSLISVNKNLVSYDGIYVKLINFTTNTPLKKEDLECNNLNQNIDIQKTTFKKYEYSKLNENIKNNIKSINDYILFNDNNDYNYIILCDLTFDENILKNINLNKNVNSLVNKIQKNFLRKYKNEYKYIKIK